MLFKVGEYMAYIYEPKHVYKMGNAKSILSMRAEVRKKNVTKLHGYVDEIPFVSMTNCPN